MANLLPSGAQELSVAEDATSFTISGILLELSDVLPGDELCVSGASAPILALDDSGTHTLGIPWPGSTIVDSTSWWIRRVSDQRYSGFFTAQQASRVQTHFAQALALSLPYKVLSETNTPPGSPEEGDRHLIGTSPTGAWSSNAKNIATWANGAWVFAAPQVGDTCAITDAADFRLFDDSLLWQPFAVAGGTLTSALNWAAAVDVASATTTDIGAAGSNLVRITGTTTITGLGTAAAGTPRWVRFAGALTLTHNGTSLILPGGANITTAANDTMLAVSLGSGNWQVYWYQPAAGYARLVPSTTAGRLARFTDTAGGMGQSIQSEDGSGNVTWGSSGNRGNLTSAGFRHGDANTPAARFDASAASVSQTASVSFSARGRPNAFEWGHGNAAGYANTFGYQSSSGRPYIVFNGEAGSTVINTIRTRGIPARGFMGNNDGSMDWITVANANADDQTIISDARFTASASFALGGTTANITGITRALTIQDATAGNSVGLELASGGSNRAILRANNVSVILNAVSLDLLLQKAGSTKVTVGTNTVDFAVPPKLPSYTVGTVPAAATAGAGAKIYVTNEAGGAVPAFSDGTDWRRVTDRAVIS
jgi:hypothetical protein